MKIMEFWNFAHAGVIDEAPTFAEAFARALNFLLQVFGFLGIIALVVAGIIYFTAAGDENRIAVAKKMTFFVIVGVLIGLGAMVIVRTIGSLM